MNYNIYFSPTGGTKRVSDIVANGLFDRFENVDLCKDINNMEMSAGDVCIFSVPSYGGRVPEIAINRICKIKGNGAVAILVCVYGNRAWEDTLTELQDTLENCGFVCVSAVSAIAEHSLLRQFAKGRPDEADEKQLLQFAERIKEKLNSGVFGKLNLEGNHGEYKPRPVGGPFKPSADDKCVGCMACANNCPVGAIDKNNPHITDKDLCISCMRCISLCPVGARDLDPALLETMGEKMAKALGGHKENFLFLCGEI